MKYLSALVLAIVLAGCGGGGVWQPSSDAEHMQDAQTALHDRIATSAPGPAKAALIAEYDAEAAALLALVLANDVRPSWCINGRRYVGDTVAQCLAEFARAKEPYAGP